jgi:hypothetical protein
VLAAVAIAAASMTAASASASTQPVVRTKAQWQAAISHVQQPGAGCYNASYPALTWHAVRCVAAPKIRFAPTTIIGDGNDYSAVVTGKISKAVGTFTHVSSGITEKGQVGGTGSKVANVFSLQLNTEFISGSPACSGASNPSDCQAWQQFIYAYQGTGSVFMQYWLIDYNTTCPSGWIQYSTDCYTNSNSVNVKKLTAAQLATTQLAATAKTGGTDGVSLTVGSAKATLVTGPDTMIDLAKFWNTTEWGLFGDGGGSEAYFGTGTSPARRTTSSWPRRRPSEASRRPRWDPRRPTAHPEPRVAPSPPNLTATTPLAPACMGGGQRHLSCCCQAQAGFAALAGLAALAARSARARAWPSEVSTAR